MKQVEIFLGRMQPIHLGHKAIIESMKNPIVVLVKGNGKGKPSPFSTEYQLKLLEKVCPGIEVSVSPNGFIPGIVGYFGKKDIEVTKIYAGADRISGYKRQAERSNLQLEFEETKRITSATAVRDAIKRGDVKEFKKLMPPELWSEFNKMKEILTFKEFIAETEATTTTSNVAIVDKPLGKILKRKKGENDASTDSSKKVQDQPPVS
jgi:FAD synthase